MTLNVRYCLNGLFMTKCAGCGAIPIFADIGIPLLASCQDKSTSHS